MEGPDDRSEGAEERRANRPYRRFVGLVFSLLLLIVAIGILRGIIQRLDRLPQVDNFARPDRVDDRALRACAEDLARLELQIRSTAGQSFARDLDQGPVADWREEAPRLETERLRVVARCRLHETAGDAVVADLSTAADQIESMLRSYSLLFDRHLGDGEKAALDARASLRRARDALKAR